MTGELRMEFVASWNTFCMSLNSSLSLTVGEARTPVVFL